MNLAFCDRLVSELINHLEVETNLVPVLIPLEGWKMFPLTPVKNASKYRAFITKHE